MHHPHLFKSLLIAFAAWASLPAQAADGAGSTDQVVVKYRSGSVQRLDARSLSRAMVAASRFSMTVQSAASQTDGAFVLRLDRCVPVKYAKAVASELESMDDQVEYAHIDIADGTCSPAPGFRYATAR